METVGDAAMTGYLLYAGALGLILLGVFAVVSFPHVVRMLLGLSLVDAGVNLFIVATGFRPQAAAPILVGVQGSPSMVDPIPQALVLTSIVIDVAVLALALALTLRAYRAYGTLDMRALARALGTDGARPHPALPVTGRELR